MTPEPCLAPLRLFERFALFGSIWTDGCDTDAETSSHGSRSHRLYRLCGRESSCRDEPVHVDGMAIS